MDNGMWNCVKCNCKKIAKDLEVCPSCFAEKAIETNEQVSIIQPVVLADVEANKE